MDNDVKALLSGQDVLVTKPKKKVLVGRHGRFISPQGIKGEVVDASRQYHLIPPAEINYAAVLERLKQSCPDLVFCSVEEFEASAKKLLEEVKADKPYANLHRGVCLPLPYPQFDMGADYGDSFEGRILPGVEASCQQAFPNRKFHNYRQSKLAGRVQVVPESRHDRFLQAMKDRSGVVLYYPNPLQGFGIEADREMMAHLPDHFVLTGAVDTAFAIAAYPEVLARDFETPVLDCAANTYGHPSFSLCFGPGVDSLGFGSRSLSAGGGCSGGVLRFGQ